MEQEYSTSAGYKIFYGFGAMALIGFTFFLIIAGKGGGINHYPSIVILPSIAIILATIIILNLFKRRLIISENRVNYRNIWRERELEKQDIKGYRVLDKSIIVYPLTDDFHKINIRDYSSLSGVAKIIKDLNQNYTDLDKLSYEGNLNEIYNNAELGNNQDERIDKFNKSKKVSLVYNVGGICLFIISLIFTEFFLDNDAAKVIVLLYPIAGIAVLIINKGLIKLVTGRSSAFGGIALGMYLSVITVMIIAFSHYDLIDYSNIWLPYFIIALITGILLWKYGYDRSENKVKMQTVILILISFFYSYPFVVYTNCMLDKSSPVTTTTKILERHILHNNGRDYCHVTVAVWYNGIQAKKDLHINHGLYDKLGSQEIVHLNIKKGLFNVPWLYITP